MRKRCLEIDVHAPLDFYSLVKNLFSFLQTGLDPCYACAKVLHVAECRMARWDPNKGGDRERTEIECCLDAKFGIISENVYWREYRGNAIQ